MAVDAAWVPVLPSMKDYAPALVKGVTSAAKQAGAAGGTALSKAMDANTSAAPAEKMVNSLKKAADQSARAVAQETAAIGKARASERDAAAKVTTTEAKLAEARSKQQDASSAVTAAEEKLAKARATSGDGSAEATAAEAELAGAREKEASANATVSAAEQRLEAARNRHEAATVKVNQTEVELKAAYEQNKVVTGQLTEAEKNLATTQAETPNRLGRIRSALSQVTASEGEAAGGASALRTRFESVGTGIRSALGKIMSLGKMVGGFAIFSGAADMMEQAREYQDALTRMSSVSGANADQMKRAQTEAVKLGGDLKLPSATAADAAAAMTELAGAGANAEQAIAGARSVLLLQASASTDAATASKTLGDVMDQFGLRVNDTAKYTENAAHVTDVLTNVTTSASLGIDEVYDSMKYAGPVARSFGISVDEVGGALIELAKNGLKGDTAGTALREMLASLANPSKAAATALDDLGVQAFDAQGNFVGLPKVLDQLQAAQQRMGSSSQQFQGDVAAAFGTRNLAAIQLFARGGSKELDEYTKKAGKAGSAQTIAAKSATTMSGAAKNLRKVLVNAGDEITSKYSDQIAAGTNALAVRLKSGFELLMSHEAQIKHVGRTVLDVIRSVVDFSHQHSTIFKALVIGAGAAFTAFKVLGAVGRIISPITGVLKIVTFGVKGLGFAFSGLWTIIKGAAALAVANPVIAGIMLVTAAAVYFFTKTKTGQRIIKDFWNDLKRFHAWVGPAWSNLWNGAGEKFSTFWHNVGKGWDKVWNGAGKGLSTTGRTIAKGWSDLWAGAGRKWSSFWHGAVSIGSAFGSRLKAVVISQVLNLVTGGINALRNLRRGFSDIFGGIRTIASSVSRLIKDVVTGNFGALKGDAIRVFGAMRDGIGQAWSGIKRVTATPINFVIQTVYTHGLKALADKVFSKLGLHITLPTIKPIGGYAGGGVIPGYAPGRDTELAVLSKGEAVLVPELVRAIGPSRILAANAAASGRRPGGATSHYAGGGISGALSSVGGFFKDKWEGLEHFVGNVAGSVKDLIAAPVRSLLEGSGTGIFAEMGKGVIEKALSGLTGFFKKQTSNIAGAPTAGLVGAAMQAVRASVPYVWGGSSVPPGLDCSGLVYWAAEKLGLGWPRLTAAGYQAGSTPVPLASAGPGSLLFYGSPAYHVAINAGNGMMVEEPHPGAVARYTKIWGNPTAGVYGGSKNGLTYDSLVQRTLAAAGSSATVGQIQNRLYAAQYDTGGALFPGITAVVNASGKPEAILNHQQWQNVKQIADGGKTPVVVTQENHFTQSDPYVAGTIASRQLIRELQAKGVSL